VVNEAVEMIKRSYFRKQGGFVNAVLRRVAGIVDVQEFLGLDLDSVEGLATMFSHPEFLVQRWLEREDPAAVRSWLARSNDAPTHHLVVNTRRISFDDFVGMCAGAELEIVAVHSDLETVEVDGSFTRIQPLIEAGHCFAQDLWSHVLIRMIPPGEYARILDCCAAPGGKSFSLALRFPEAVKLAADVSPARLLAMQARAGNLAPSGLHLAGADSRRPPWRPGRFDLVVLDAPCSGTGTLQRNPDLRWKLDLPRILRLTHLQRELLEAVAPLVRAGGLLVYATCSAEREENEWVVANFLKREEGAFAVEKPAELRPDTVTGEGFYRTFPGAARGEGFFGAFLRRLADG
jgi:16S rRNA (cytosine967-C5)-methyltransferase